MRAIVPLDEGSYSYAGIGYANPDAVSQIANGLSTTTYSYDQNGNLVQKTTDGVTTTYVWDYANRLIALGSGGATTTYGYDAFGSRVFQSTATTTTLYPFKWYSVASSTGSYATTTEYVFNGDTLVSTIDQQLASGAATGTPQTRYIHPDHLGSTNVVTDASGNVRLRASRLTATPSHSSIKMVCVARVFHSSKVEGVKVDCDHKPLLDQDGLRGASTVWR